jgi:poly-gamma-glutamate capsule biosynthesis protein CapA/YwtB (metallophosphatase superfamily)
VVPGSRSREESDLIETRMTTSRRNLLLLPVLGLLPRRIGIGSTSPPSAEVRILFGGDIMLSRYVGRLARERHDPAWPLHEIAPLLASADIAFANLESPFSDLGHGFDRGMVFRAEPKMIAGLNSAGIDVVSTANNHVRDAGRHGIEFTLDLLKKNRILAVGTGATAELAHQGVILERKGVGFGFLGYTFDQSNGNHTDIDDRIAMLDVNRMRADVESLLKRTDVVIVSMHAGVEYQPNPNALQQEFAQAAIDAGARAVIGHHPHVVQTVELYGSGIIFYSLGNLVFDQFQLKTTQLGWLADLRFQGPRLVGYGIIPVDIVNTVARIHPLPGAPATS